MAISLLYNPYPVRLFEADGDFAAGAKAYFYLARTTTPLAVYTDSPLGVPHPWPVIADAFGLLPPVYLATGTEYKVRIEDALGSLLYAADGIANSAEGEGGGGALPIDAYTKAQSDASFVNVDGDTMVGNLSISKSAPSLSLNKPAAGTNSGVLGAQSGKARWLVALGDGAAESGGNAGSDFTVNGYNDAGAYLNTPLRIDRATGTVTVSSLTATGELKANGVVRLKADNTRYLQWDGVNYVLGGLGNVWATGNFNPASYAPIGGVTGDWVVGSATIQTDGNIYMPWASDTLANVFNRYALLSGAAFSGNVDIAGATVRMTGLPTSVVAANCHIANTESNRFYRFNSSAATKTQIEPIEDAYGDKILDLKPVFFRSLNEADNPSWSWFGFIAEEVDEVDFRFCTYDDVEGEVPGAWNVNAVVAALVQLVQRQEARIRALEGAGQ